MKVKHPSRLLLKPKQNIKSQPFVNSKLRLSYRRDLRDAPLHDLYFHLGFRSAGDSGPGRCGLHRIRGPHLARTLNHPARSLFEVQVYRTSYLRRTLAAGLIGRFV